MLMVESSLHLLPSLKEHGSTVAAFTEETFKTLAIIIGVYFSIIFTLTLAIIEMFNYFIVVLRQSNELPISFMVFRMFCVAVHLTTLLIQLYFFQLYQERKEGAYWAVGYLFAVFLHLVWNKGLGVLVLRAIDYSYKYTVMLLGS